MTGQLTLYRDGGWSDWVRAYKIYVDGTEHGTIKRNSQLDLSLPAGRYDISAGLDWCGSNTVAITLGAGDEIAIKVENPHSPFKARNIITNAPETYLRLTVG